MISDTTLMTIANSTGILSVIFIILYQFVEVNAKRAAELNAAAGGHSKLD